MSLADKQMLEVSACKEVGDFLPEANLRKRFRQQNFKSAIAEHLRVGMGREPTKVSPIHSTAVGELPASPKEHLDHRMVGDVRGARENEGAGAKQGAQA